MYLQDFNKRSHATLLKSLSKMDGNIKYVLLPWHLRDDGVFPPRLYIPPESIIYK